DLANVVIHESVHATLYLNGQSVFNESLAFFVAERLTPLYLKQQFGNMDPRTVKYLADVEEGRKSGDRVKKANDVLDALYGSGSSTEEKRAKKKAILEALRKELGGKREWNNASLIQFKTYGTGKAEFAKILASCQGDVSRFLRFMETEAQDAFKAEQIEELSD